MRRRDVLKSALAATAALAAPNIVAAETKRVLKFVPQADLATLDPVWTTADVTRNHAHLVFDTLYGQDNNFQPHPQMAAGHVTSADGRQCDITLRDGLECFAEYVARTDGPAEMTAGPKVVHFDRVDWSVVPDPATKAAAMRAGEFDWWENPTIDLLGTLKREPGLTSVVKDHSGSIGIMRFNCLYPPFDNPAIRRIVLSAIDQREFMEAVAGAAPELIKTGIGLFVPGTALASDVGVAMMQGPKDPAKLKAELAVAGYKGEPVALLAASDFPVISALSMVGGDLLKRIGFNVDYQSLDWGTVVQRRASREPIDKGGWNMFFTYGGGTGNVSPASLTVIRSNPATAWFGWPDDPKMEALRLAWYDAPDLAAQQKLCREMQARLFENPSYAPLGLFFQPTVFRSDLTGIPEGIPQFYRVRRAI